MVSFDDLIPQARRSSTAEQRYVAEEEAQRKANEEANILAQFGRGVKAQAGRFALGTAELANNLTGDRLIDPEILAMSQRGADVIDRGTGAAGFVGNIAGDPLSWALAGVGGAGIKGAKTTGEAAKAAAKASAITGGASGLVQSTGDEKSNIGSNIANAAIGSAIGFGLGGAAPYVGSGIKKGASMAGGFTDRIAAGFGSNNAANRVAYRNIADALKNQGYAPSEVASVLDEFKAQGIQGGTLGQMIGSTDLLAREKNLLQGGGLAGRIMKENLESQPDLVAESLGKKLGEIYQPDTTSYLYTQASDIASVPTYREKMGAVTQNSTTAANKYLTPAVNTVEASLKANSNKIPKTVKNSISSIISDMRNGVIGVDKGKQMLDDLYVDGANTTEQKTVNSLVLGMRKNLNIALEEAGGEPYAAAKIAAESDRVISDALETFDTTNVGSLKTALNKFYGTPEKKREFLDKLPNEAVRKDFKNYLDNLEKVAGKFTGSDTASNQATQAVMNAESGFGVQGGIGIRDLVQRAAVPLQKNIRKAQANATFNTDMDMLMQSMRGKPYSIDRLSKAAPQTAIRVPEAISQEERDSNRPVITQQPQAPIDFNDLIPQAPQSNAVQGDVMSRIAQVESGGNPNAKNPNSSAAGLFQFTNDTWNASVQRWGKELGIKQGDKMNPQAQEAMARKLAESNAQYIQKNLGIQPDDGHIYLAHFMGAPAAVKLMRNYGKGASAAQIFPKEAKANQRIFFDANGRARTIEQVYDIVTSKVRVA